MGEVQGPPGYPGFFGRGKALLCERFPKAGERAGFGGGDGVFSFYSPLQRKKRRVHSGSGIQRKNVQYRKNNSVVWKFTINLTYFEIIVYLL